MTAPDLQELTRQIKERLAEAPLLADMPFIEGSVDPENPTLHPPYLVMYLAFPGRTESPLSRRSGRLYLHSATMIVAGEDAHQAKFFTGIVDGQLDGWKPNIPGWDHSRFAGPGTPAHSAVDESFTPPLDYYRLEYTSTATRK